MTNPTWWKYLLAVLAIAVLAACSNGNNSSPTPDVPIVEDPVDPVDPVDPKDPDDPEDVSEVPNEIMRGSMTVAGGALLVVPADAEEFGGTTISIPANAAIEDANVQVGFERAAPGAFRDEALAAGVRAVSTTLVIKVAGGKPATFNKPVTITMPYDTAAAEGLPPAVLFWDPDAGRYRTVAVVGVDRVEGMVTFSTSHFSDFLAAVVTSLGLEVPAADTGFQLGVDSILHQNFGSYEFGGHCAAFASLSTHYFSLNKPARLYNFAQEGAIEQPVDDEVTRTALALTYTLIVGKWADFADDIVIPSAIDTGLLMIASMIITGDPLHLVMHSANGQDGGHSVTAFAYDATAQRFRIYDSNFPKNEVTFDWNVTDGFGAYSRAASYPAAMFDFIGYASDDTFGAPAQFQQILADWEGGTLEDYFAWLRINDQDGDVQSLIFGNNVTTTIPYEDDQVVTGRFSRPPGSTNPVFLHVYHDGELQGPGVPMAASGDFTLPFPSKLEQKVEVMLLVSEHANDTGRGFTAFGKFIVQPEGRNFFTNLGFETGDLTGWNTKTTLLYNGSDFTPTKTTVTGVGFDPIAFDIPTAVFGAHAVKVNDETPNYHTTFVSQEAVVPATGNPQLKFQWAAVLEDPQHSPQDQPYVDVVVVNKTKVIELYRRRFFTNDPDFGGWEEYPHPSNPFGEPWKAIPWQTVLLTGLSQYAGDVIELRIEGADCALGGHGGYVYLDGEE